MNLERIKEITRELTNIDAKMKRKVKNHEESMELLALEREALTDELATTLSPQ